MFGGQGPPGHYGNKKRREAEEGVKQRNKEGATSKAGAGAQAGGKLFPGKRKDKIVIERDQRL